MYGTSYGPLDQLRMRAEAAEQEATRARLQARMWRSAAFVWILVGMMLGFMAGNLKALAAEAVQGHPHGVVVECWRFDAAGQRRLVWRATGRSAWTELRGDIDVLVVAQDSREIQVDVADGMACFVRPDEGASR
jgi:hypothetical protein